MRLNFALGTQKACVVDCASETLCASHSERSADHAHVVTAAQPDRARRNSKRHAPHRTQPSPTRAAHARRHARKARTSSPTHRTQSSRAQRTHARSARTLSRTRSNCANICAGSRSAVGSVRGTRAPHLPNPSFKPIGSAAGCLEFAVVRQSQRLNFALGRTKPESDLSGLWHSAPCADQCWFTRNDGQNDDVTHSTPD